MRLPVAHATGNALNDVFRNRGLIDVFELIIGGTCINEYLREVITLADVRTLRDNLTVLLDDPRVQAAELRFNSAPSTSLQITGCPQMDTSLVVVRSNLPTPVQPGVTYRNIVVDFKLLMILSELECVLAGKPCALPVDSSRIR